MPRWFFRITDVSSNYFDVILVPKYNVICTKHSVQCYTCQCQIFHQDIILVWQQSIQSGFTDVRKSCKMSTAAAGSLVKKSRKPTYRLAWSLFFDVLLWQNTIADLAQPKRQFNCKRPTRFSSLFQALCWNSNLFKRLNSETQIQAFFKISSLATNPATLYNHNTTQWTYIT